MKASIIITVLKQFIKERGDLPVTVDDGRNCSEADAFTIEFREKDDGNPDRIFIGGDWQ